MVNVKCDKSKTGSVLLTLFLNDYHYYFQKSSFLMLSGPTGSGKTTTLNVLCKKLGISILEWVNPTDRDNEVFKGINQIKRFTEFLTDSKWHSLFETGSSRNITLVKDFPNAVIFHPEEFFGVLK